eukprot:m.337378 g.337378  ORF g.337378 m.337378 type:complete len:165 (-) comp20549_c1_seq14:691-1185(-)
MQRWMNIDASVFKLRVGPNYKKHGKKESSLPAFYEVVTFDYYKCDTVHSNIASIINLPVPKHISPHPDIPSLFIMNYIVPDIKAAMMSPPSEGPCVQVVFIAQLKQEVVEVLKNMDTAPPVYKLFAEWCKHGTEHPQYKGCVVRRCLFLPRLHTLPDIAVGNAR